MARAKDMNVPHSADIVEIEMHRNTLKWVLCKFYILNNFKIGHNSLIDIEERLVKKCAIKSNNCWVTFNEFTELLKITPTPENADAHQQLFDIYDKDEQHRIDIRQYLIGALFLYKKEDMAIDFIEYISMVLNENFLLQNYN